MEILLFPEDYADGQGDFRVHDTLRCEPLETAARRDGVVLSGSELPVHPDVAFQKSREVLKLETAAGFRDIERRIDLEQGLGFDRAFQMQMQFSQHYLT